MEAAAGLGREGSGKGAQPSLPGTPGHRALPGAAHRIHETPVSYHLAKALVFSKVRNALGLDHCQFPISGAGPLSPDTAEFFLSLDIPVGEMYGMSESSGPHTVSNWENYKILRYQPPGQSPDPAVTQGPGEEDRDVGRPRPEANPDLVSPE